MDFILFLSFLCTFKIHNRCISFSFTVKLQEKQPAVFNEMNYDNYLQNTVIYI